MKTVIRLSGLAVLAAAFFAITPVASFAQDQSCADTDGQNALYSKFTELYPKTDLPSRKEAVNSAKSFVEKYGTCEALKEQIDYFKKAIPALEEAIRKIEDGIWLSERFKRFDAGIKANNPDEVYAAGREILTKQPDNMNIILPMGLIGAYQSTAQNNYKYANEGLQNAEMALSKINAGAPFSKAGGKAGAFQFEMTKEDAIDQLKYAKAYLNYYGKKDKAAALPIYYELSQGDFKDDPRIYGTIGDYYVDQRKPVAEQIRVKITEQLAAGTTEERKVALEAEIKPLVALFNGYNERILDAYGRAYSVTKDTPANKAYRDNLYKIMQDVYKNRFPDKESGLDSFISQSVAKPFPNPTSEVTPVSDPEPTKDATSNTTGQPASSAATGKTAGTAATAKPVGAKTATTKPKK